MTEPRLRAVVEAIFAAAGSQPRECALAADHLVEANLRGHDSHGVGMIPAYIENIGLGELKLNTGPEIVLDNGSLLVCDGRLGLGQTVAHDAIDLAIARAKQGGSCILALRNSHHIGRIGHWAEQCAAQGLVSIHLVNVNSDPVVAPYGGRAARLVTNPFCAGIPRQGEPPIIVDFATSKLAMGKVRVAFNKGVDLPDGVLLDRHGEPTNDPGVMFAGEKGGAILPFGDHKGWGLALACELIAGALTGGGTQSGPRKSAAIINNMVSIVLSPEHMGTADRFHPEMEAFIEWAKSPPPGRDATVLVAGEPELAYRAERLARGIPVDAATWEQILLAGETVGCRRDTLAELAGQA
ncbi:malate/lactate/ureidoglycolate dehydrogenase [Alsobacter sp. SYSU M60028]|uniref:Malate/lactate/ureidoglycolate dehydrogenase n=1 Tax=Alsobacter ponti TaxID=2962936 RepID=A0ABT1LEW3_9HYPH|nr:malate/lactate/ureidoglycolate dehydrogenase [Alsobacter ponti]